MRFVRHTEMLRLLRTTVKYELNPFEWQTNLFLLDSRFCFIQRERVSVCCCWVDKLSENVYSNVCMCVPLALFACVNQTICTWSVCSTMWRFTPSYRTHAVSCCAHFPSDKTTSNSEAYCSHVLICCVESSNIHWYSGGERIFFRYNEYYMSRISWHSQRSRDTLMRTHFIKTILWWIHRYRRLDEIALINEELGLVCVRVTSTADSCESSTKAHVLRLLSILLNGNLNFDSISLCVFLTDVILGFFDWVRVYTSIMKLFKKCDVAVAESNIWYSIDPLIEGENIFVAKEIEQKFNFDQN